MRSLFSKNTIILVVAALVIGAVVWYLFSGEKSDSLLTTESTATGQSTAERGIVETLLTLRAVSLSGAIFSDPAFKILKDFGTQIVPEPVGRKNPFAPRTPQSGAPKPSGTTTTR